MPREIGFFRPLWRKSPRHRQCVLTLLRMYTLQNKKISYSVRTITDAYTGKRDFTLLDPNIVQIFRNYKIKVRNQRTSRFEVGRTERQWHLSHKAGPNGKVAFLRIFQDKEALLKQPRLRDDILKLARLMNLPKVERVLASKVRLKEVHSEMQEICTGKHRDVPKKPPFKHSRLEFISEGGGKTRVVALGDIFTQSVLKPLHKHLYSILKDIEPDCTFDQEKGVKRLKA